jgi:hypothetical protein
VTPAAVAGTREAGLVPLSPIPLLGGALTCRQWSVALSPHGVTGWLAQSLQEGARPRRSGCFVAFDAARAAGESLGELHVGGRAVARGLPRERARELARWIDGLAALPEPRRAAAIESGLRASFDLGAIRALGARHAAACEVLAPWCNALLLLLFVALPLLVWQRGVIASAPFLLLGLLPAWLATLAAFFVAHRRLHPERRRERWARCASLAILPPAAVRAQDLLGRDLLAAFDPLAAVVALCSREDARPFARRALLDLRHPSPLGAPPLEPGAEETERWFRGRLLEVAEAALGDEGLDLAELLRPAEREEGCASACPRCERQYVMAEGECYECGLALAPFEGERPAACPG